MYVSKSYDGVVYVALPSLSQLGGPKRHLWFKLVGNGTPKSVTADTVPCSVRKLAYNQFWERKRA